MCAGGCPATHFEEPCQVLSSDKNGQATVWPLVPCHARPDPIGTAASGSSAAGSSANNTDDTAPNPNTPAAQRDRIPARSVATPKLSGPSMYRTPSSDHSVG